jgi:hypothetical protein
MSEIEKVKEVISFFQHLSEKFNEEAEKDHHEITKSHFEGASTAYRLAAEHLEHIFFDKRG